MARIDILAVWSGLVLAVTALVVLLLLALGINYWLKRRQIPFAVRLIVSLATFFVPMCALIGFTYFARSYVSPLPQQAATVQQGTEQIAVVSRPPVAIPGPANRTAQPFVDHSTVSHPTVSDQEAFALKSILLIGGVAFFAILAVIIGLHVWMKQHSTAISLRAIVLGGVSLLWLLPVIAVLFWIGLRATANTQAIYNDFEQRDGGIVHAPQPVPEIPAAAVLERTAAAVVPGPAADAKTPSAESPPTNLLPDWLARGTIREGDKILAVVSSQQFAEIPQAEDQALELAGEIVSESFRARYPAAAGWKVPHGEVNSLAVQNRFVEAIDRKSTTSDTPFRVYRVHLQVETSERVNSALQRMWQEVAVAQRLKALGALGGLLTLVFATSSVYLRLDDRTAGAYRWRLRVAAVSLIVAGGLAAATLV